ncbi:hypothetical protein CHS0354_001981 [Potamilus streckersoni]|uniref:beta-galactosidase n=1 Tax=Potamilus streckersoni TaxID=2493646 RepID=A0AAE0T6D1_9BIVA|nr:hypothetical protein CHS0354_001981 [Potamilus streckersoni]
MEYSDFEQIECPNLNVTEPNPSQVMDFRRFSSDQVIRFNRTQTEIIRRLSPGRFITHNSMGMFFDYDHYPFAEDLDFISWDNYPLGFLSVSDCFDADEKQIYLRTGHPDLSPFMHDLFRGQSAQKKFWVIEQQPGPVNWAPYNPAPAKGIVRLWTWQNFAHGAETVSYFRWRRCHFAQEQMHAGLNAPDGEFTEYADEVRRTENEIKEVNRFLQHTEYKQAALVFDYENFWHLEIQPQGSDFKPLRLFMNFYRAMRELGLSVDIVPKTADLSAYPLVVIPCMPFEDEVFCKKIQSLKSRVMIGPRTFSKTTDFQLPEASGLNLFSRLFNFRIRYVESLPASYRENVYPQKGGNSYVFSYWKESLTTGDRPVAWYADGEPATVENGNFTYCAFFPEADFLTEYIAGLPELSVQLGQPLKQLPAGVRVRRLHNLYFYFNLSEAAYHIEAQQLKDKDVIVGAPVIAPNDLTVLCLK